ncbi:MAG: hypothetical protein HN597_14890 [Desulfobacula sp.]|jgi:hypothetical protein|uniref:hypothetical protein n=1 Tax=Desulfobacula sp. TaxID=2593537 RepID=UPI0039B86D22|nr:hypothetical protein [Desulfobacula sp.]
MPDLNRDQKQMALKTAVEVTKEAARGGNAQPYSVLKLTYEELLKLMKDVESSN